MAKSKYQAYDTETISRDMIKNAPYNPRIMDEKAKKRLRKKHCETRPCCSIDVE